MSSFRRIRRARGLTYLLLVAMLAPLLPAMLPPARAAEQTRAILLFPVTDESASGVSELRKVATDALQMAIGALKSMECTEFSRSSPMVRRAVAEGRVLQTQVESTVTDPREAIRIGHALNLETVVMASVQSYRSTEEPRSVELILAGQAYDVKPNYNEQAGEAVQKPVAAQAFGVVGTSRKLPGYKGPDRPLWREAVDDAAYRVAQVLNGASMSEVSVPRPSKKGSSIAKWIAIGAAVGLLAWAIGSSGGKGTSGASPDAVPPTPLPLQLEGTTTIQISWTPPTGTSYTILQYQLQRSVDGGPYSYFGTGGQTQSLAATTTQYPDFGVTSGHSYSYRIRVFYTNSKFSEWAYFAGVRVAHAGQH